MILDYLNAATRVEDEWASVLWYRKILETQENLEFSARVFWLTFLSLTGTDHPSSEHCNLRYRL